MSVQSREAKVFAALLVSMTAGAMLLVALGNNPPSAGAFCLDNYYQLDPVEKAISSRAARYPGRWNYIEIYYSGTQAGNIEQLASLKGLAAPKDLDCHFCLCNGLGGDDGQIQPTESWQRQRSIIPHTGMQMEPILRPFGKRRIHVNDRTIRICVVADGKTARPTNYQMKRTEALVQQLCREFNIAQDSICYPGDWQ